MENWKKKIQDELERDHMIPTEYDQFPLFHYIYKEKKRFFKNLASKSSIAQKSLLSQQKTYGSLYYETAGELEFLRKNALKVSFILTTINARKLQNEWMDRRPDILKAESQSDPYHPYRWLTSACHNTYYT